MSLGGLDPKADDGAAARFWGRLRDEVSDLDAFDMAALKKAIESEYEFRQLPRVLQDICRRLAPK